MAITFFGGERVHNRRPSQIDPFEDEGSIFDGTVHEKSLRKTAWLENQARLSFFQHIRRMQFNIAEMLGRNP